MKPPIVQVAGMHRARRRRVDSEAWTWIASLDGQRLFFPPNVAGWNDDRWLDTSTLRGRWIAANYVAYAVRARHRRVERQAPVRCRKARRPRAGLLGQPDDDLVDPDDAAAFAQTALDDADSTWKRDDVPGADRQRPPDSHRRLPRLPDLLTMSCSCNEFSRATALRRSVAEAGRGLPVIEPGMPIPAGTGLDRRGFLARAAGLALSVYGAGKLPLGLFEEGIARAQSAPAGPVLVSVFLEGGADSLSMLFPAGNAQYAAFRPQLALPAGRRASRSPRTRACAGTPRSRRWPSCTARAR